MRFLCNSSFTCSHRKSQIIDRPRVTNELGFFPQKIEMFAHLFLYIQKTEKKPLKQTIFIMQDPLDFLCENKIRHLAFADSIVTRKKKHEDFINLVCSVIFNEFGEVTLYAYTQKIEKSVDFDSV